MNIPGVNSSILSPAPSTAAPTASPATLGGQSQFLQLLVAQLQHQDPLTPQDGTAFVAQLAQFASLEQATQTNQQLAGLQNTALSNAQVGYANLIGRQVTARSSSLDVPLSATNPLSATLSAPAKSVDVSILDASGRIVRTLHLGPTSAGHTVIPWDGKNDQGAAVPNGQYQVNLTAVGADGKSVGAYSEVSGRIDSLSFKNGSICFQVGSRTLVPSDIESIDSGL